MGSRKRSAMRREKAAFEADLEAMDFGDAFDRERRRSEELAAHRDEARRDRSCESKTRYATRGEALDAIRRCAERGRGGLSCYRCSYCHGWHLTSHPWG